MVRVAHCSGDNAAAFAVCYPARVSTTSAPLNTRTPRHSAVVRATHWITVFAFFALLISGGEIVISHPRFYWGETGNVMMRPWFTIPIPSSRGTVPTGYSFGMPDANGWSRSLHFQAAWVLVLTGLVYGLSSLWTGHFRKNLVPAKVDRTWRALWGVMARYFHRAPQDEADAQSYNAVQRMAYMAVIFVLFPMVIWTGLALSPAFDSAFPMAVDVLGGRQSARTLHFFITGFLVIFLIVHVAMVYLGGFKRLMRGMITGRVTARRERV